MISKLFSIRNYIMKQLMKTTDEGIMQIPDKGKVDFGEMIIKEDLFKKGIDPKAITSESQLDNILNTPSVAPKVKPKKTGEVIDVDFGKNWPEKKAGGGRTGSGLNYLLGEDDQNMRVPYGEGSSWDQFQKEKLMQKWQEYQQYLKNREKEKRQKPYIEERLGVGPGPVLEAAEGGRIAFGLGGFNKARRAFLQMMGAGAATAGAAKSGLLGLLKGGKKEVAAPATQHLNKVVDGADGMPSWFKPLVNKVIKEGEDISSKASTIEREIVHTAKLPDSQTDVIVTQNLNTGDVSVEIGMGKHGWADGHHGQPVRLEYKAAEDIMTGPDMDDMHKVGVREPHVKTKVRDEMTFEKTKHQKTPEEFWVEEAEFTGGHPENVKFEDVSYEKFGEHGSDFTEVEKFATGKVKKAKPLKKRKATQWNEGSAQAEADAAAERGHWIDDRAPEADDFASGGRVPLGGGKLVLEGLMKLANKISPGTTKLGKTSRPMASKTELKRSIAGFQERQKAARKLTDDEIDDLAQEVGELDAYDFDGTVGSANRIRKEHKAYMDDMYKEYKRDKLKVWNDPDKVRAAVDDIFSTGDYKYDAEMAAEALVENNPKAFGGKLLDDIDDATRMEIYGAVLRVVQSDLAKTLQLKRLSRPTKTLEGIKKTGTINISDDAVADEFTRFMKETDPKGHKKIEEIVEITNFDPKGRKKNSSGGLAGMLGE